MRKRIVYPNRIALPITLPETLVTKLRELGFEMADQDDFAVATPKPLGVVRIIAHRA